MMIDQNRSQIPLVVDLDGTLIKSDMLFETLCSAVSKNFKSIAQLVSTSMQGRAQIKRKLVDISEIDVAQLPYNEKVLEYIKAQRKKKISVILVTASDQLLASAIGNHLKLFDEVYGSNGQLNLKGDKKKKFLTEKFGSYGYNYMGDSYSDLPVWSSSAKAVTVNCSFSLRSKVELVALDTEHIGNPKREITPYLKALRPHQWAKNVLVFIPMLLAHQINIDNFIKSVAAFIAFSIVASAIYIINDLLDLDADRKHPRKRYRPFASGAIPILHGIGMSFLLLMIVGLFSFFIDIYFVAVLFGYFLLTLAYSLILKRWVIIDLCALSCLYTTRILAGASATMIAPSMWLIAFSTFLFFSLATVKRKVELVDNHSRGKMEAYGRDYRVEDLPIISAMAIASGYLSVLVLALYLDSPLVQLNYSQPNMMWPICFVLMYWINRIILKANRGEMDDDPLIFALQDRVSQICAILTVLLVVAGLFL